MKSPFLSHKSWPHQQTPKKRYQLKNARKRQLFSPNYPNNIVTHQSHWVVWSVVVNNLNTCIRISPSRWLLFSRKTLLLSRFPQRKNPSWKVVFNLWAMWSLKVERNSGHWRRLQGNQCTTYSPKCRIPGGSAKNGLISYSNNVLHSNKIVILCLLMISSRGFLIKHISLHLAGRSKDRLQWCNLGHKDRCPDKTVHRLICWYKLTTQSTWCKRMTWRIVQAVDKWKK